MTGRRGVLIGAAALAGLAWLAGAGLARRNRQSPTIQADAGSGDFWERSFPTLEGGSLSMASLRGMPLLVNFWATWCSPCVQELPLLNGFYAQNKANGWQLVGLALDDPDAVGRFLARSPVSFPVGVLGVTGGGIDLMRSLGNSSRGVPFTVVFGADGRSVGDKLGQLDADDLADWRKAV